MRSIRYFIVSLYYNFLFNIKLNKILKSYRDQVVRGFDRADPENSYWIECNEEYICAPQIVEDDKEFQDSIKNQTKMIIEDWQYFPAWVEKDLSGLIKYIVWLRKKYYLNTKQYNIEQNKVSDHIYEM